MANGKMKLYLRDIPVLEINENGICNILDFDRLPFALRKKDMTYRNLSVGIKQNIINWSKLCKKYSIRFVYLR